MVRGDITEVALLFCNLGLNDEFRLSVSSHPVSPEGTPGGSAPVQCYLSVSTMRLRTNSRGTFGMCC